MKYSEVADLFRRLHHAFEKQPYEDDKLEAIVAEADLHSIELAAFIVMEVERRIPGIVVDSSWLRNWCNKHTAYICADRWPFTKELKGWPVNKEKEDG